MYVKKSVEIKKKLFKFCKLNFLLENYGVFFASRTQNAKTIAYKFDLSNILYYYPTEQRITFFALDFYQPDYFYFLTLYTIKYYGSYILNSVFA